ncbi:MAG: EAL domain-containing protein [Pseudomonadota bacterium]
MTPRDSITAGKAADKPDVSLRAFLRAVGTPPEPGDFQAMLSMSGPAALLTAVNAVLYLVAVGPNDEWWFLLPWGFVTLAISGFAMQRSRRAAQRLVPRVSRRAALRLNVFAVLLGLPWGVLALLVFLAGTAHEQLLALIVCSGMAAGGSFMMHRTLTAACCYYITILGAVMLGCLLSAADILWPVAVYSAIYATSLGYFAFAAGAISRDREQLTAQLSKAAAELGQAQLQITKLARHDNVTGLPNRAALLDELARACASERPFWLVVLGLDQFNRVNDSNGFQLGDRFLAIVATRLREQLRRDDFVARLSADEYAILLPGELSGAELRVFGSRLIGAVSQPAQLAGRRISVSASAGAARFPDDAGDPRTMVADASTAMRHAKANRRGGIELFVADLSAHKAELDRIETDLRSALDNNQLAIHYQPKIDLSSGEVAGAEALLRWHHPERGFVPPDTFLPVAAERNMIRQITGRIFDIVAGDIVTWRRTGLKTGPIAVNIHAEDLKNPDPLMERLGRLAQDGVTPKDLYVEVTENCVVGSGGDAASVVLDAIVDLGFELSLDDFGTGHASLSHLKRLPVSEIKIDRSFVEGICDVPQDRAIVSATIGMARGMGLRTVAEGVEGAQQAEFLRRLGTTHGQGYYWARPMSATAFEEFVRKRGRSAAPRIASV